MLYLLDGVFNEQMLKRKNYYMLLKISLVIINPKNINKRQANHSEQPPKMISFLQQMLGSVLTSNALSIILNHLIQVYCFTYGILCLLTSLLTLTNFIYADYLLKVKPIGIASFLLFWSMKLWTSFDDWMIWINCAIAIYIGLYFYEACCNITEHLDVQQTATRNGAILLVANIGMIVAWVLLKKSQLTPKQHKIGIFGQQQNYLYLAFVLTLFGINLYRMRQRSLFPALVSILVVTSSLVVRQLLLMKDFSKNLPLQALIYLILVIDAEGRQYKKVQNKIFHHLFLTCVYFYGFVITNQRLFNSEYFLLGVCIVMLILNK